MNHLSILASLHSIRTKFGLSTACILLVLLFAFYLGGRFIMVHMIREAENDLQVISNDIKSVVYNEIGTLQHLSASVADTVSHSDSGATDEFLQAQLVPFSGDIPINLAIALGADGSFKNGCYLVPGQPLQSIAAADIQPYLTSLLTPSGTGGQHLSGVIVLQNTPVVIALSSVKDQTGTCTGFIIIGSLLHNSPVINRINEATHGIQVAMSDHRIKKHADTKERQHLAPAPVFQEALNYYSGGNWHLGENTFEAVIPISDILGREVTTISICLPRTFSAIANVALGWLTAFVATIGIIFVFPIFWLQTRVLLNPLTRIAGQIQEIGEHGLDGNRMLLDWPGKDEFGILAQSVNTMLETLSLQTKQIRQSEQRQNALIAGIPDCLCVFDPQARLLAVHKQPDYVNPVSGLTPGQPIAPPLFPESDCEALRLAIEETFRTGKIQIIIISCRESDRFYRHFETRICHMDASSALVVLRDVTKEWHEREVREQMEDHLVKVKKMESLGNLAAGIAHDFNNILAIIQNTVDLAQNTADLAQDKSVASTIRQATSKGAALIRELMTYAGQTRIAFKHDDLNRFILDMEKLLGGVIASNVALELKLTPGIPYIDADPHQFWKIIINLLKNASESMNGVPGHIRISTYSCELTEENIDAFFSTHTLSPGAGVVCQIDDTGSGMSHEVRGRIFEPFFSTKSLGRGLGLSTVFGIVDAHNGGIAIDSEVGKGTRFRIWFPISKTRADEPEPAPELPAPLSPDPGTARAGQDQTSPRPCVLLVEDDQTILQTTVLVLRSLNVDTLQAATQREALTLFRKHATSINLVLLDSQFGELDNVRLLAVFHLREPNIPVVIVSGHSEKHIREMFADEKFNGFLSKPYTRSELENILNRFAGRKPTG